MLHNEGAKKREKKDGKGGLAGSRWLPQAVGELWARHTLPAFTHQSKAELSRVEQMQSEREDTVGEIRTFLKTPLNLWASQTCYYPVGVDIL